MGTMKDKLDQWATMTYEELLNKRIQENQYRSGKEIEVARYVLQKQGIANQTMTGYSTNGLDNTEKEVGRFQYVKVFNAISKRSDWTPMDMVYGTCFLAMRDPAVAKTANAMGLSQEDLICKMCGRALRALPSYLREHDLKQQLEQRIPDAQFKQNESLDTVLHADLMMTRNGEDYFFWSYVNTDRSIENFTHKFFGHRAGIIPDGIHVACPFDLKCCNEIEGWMLYDSMAVGTIVRSLERPACAQYENIKDSKTANGYFFKTPKVIDKNDNRDREYEGIEISR